MTDQPNNCLKMTMKQSNSGIGCQVICYLNACYIKEHDGESNGAVQMPTCGDDDYGIATPARASATHYYKQSNRQEEKEAN
jgi:hypothetical protein